jgi:hypothetical protein
MDTKPALAHRHASSMMAPARGLPVARPPARGRVGFSSSKATRRPTIPGYQSRYGKAWRPPSAYSTTRPRPAPPARGANPPCRRTVARGTKFLECGHNQGVVIQGLDLPCTESANVYATQPMTSKSIGRPTATMQDEPPEEAHPAKCLSLPEVRCPEERRPSKEKRFVGRCRGELTGGCPLPAASVRVKSRSRSQTLMYWTISGHVFSQVILPRHAHCSGQCWRDWSRVYLHFSMWI